jgi:hypothetical protein
MRTSEYVDVAKVSPQWRRCIPDMDKLPSSFLKMIEHARKITAEIKTYDQQTYELARNGGKENGGKEKMVARKIIFD